MHENLLSEIVSEDLFKDWNLVTYSESEYLKKQNKNSKYLNLILSGQCIIELVRVLLFFIIIFIIIVILLIFYLFNYRFE